MFKKNQLKRIEKQTEELFKKMGFALEASASFEDEALLIDIKCDEPRALIGQGGKTLLDIQRVLQVILSHQLQKRFYLNLDINNYKKKKAQYLKETADKLADEVVLTREERVLPAMPAYERRIIHLELADRKNVATQSVGVEPERRVVIRPYP